MQFFGDFGVDGRFDPVPVEEHDDQNQYRQQHNQAGKGPGKNLGGARHCTGLLNTTERPDCDARVKR
ncbi:hypothetical protein D9M68_1001530 [compost metagenome]